MKEAQTFETPTNFVEIFKERVNNLEPLSSKASDDLSSWYKKSGLRIVKEMPAILFNASQEKNDVPTDIWVENPKGLIESTADLIHNRVKAKLRDFLGSNISNNTISAYLLEDNAGKLHLNVDHFNSEKIKPQQNKTDLPDLLNRYGISELDELVVKKDPASDFMLGLSSGVNNLINRTQLEERRESLVMINLAQAYGMSTHQYLRFILLSKELFRSGKQVSLDDLAKSIINEPNNTRIDVKHLPNPEELE